MSDHEREMLYDSIDDIQIQIDRMGEQISNILDSTQNAQTTVDSIADRVSKIEQENKAPADAREIPDSEGFWRDSDGDVWARDTVGNTLFIAKGHNEGTQEIYDLPRVPDGVLHECGPYVKIDNPFILGEDHAK